MESYIKYKAYYDRKAAAHPLTINEYCFALHPKANNQSTKLPFTEYIWTGPYKIIKVLPNNNYIIRRLNSNKTQILHRMRLRPYPTQNNLEDNCPIQEENKPDDEIPIKHDDLYANAWETLDPLEASQNIPNHPPQTSQEISLPPTIIITPDPNENSTTATEKDDDDNFRAKGEHLDHLPEILHQGNNPDCPPEILHQGDDLDRPPEISKQGAHPECPPQNGKSEQHLDELPNTEFAENNVPTPKTAPRGDKYNYRSNLRSKRHSDYVYYDTY